MGLLLYGVVRASTMLSSFDARVVLQRAAQRGKAALLRARGLRRSAGQEARPSESDDIVATYMWFDDSEEARAETLGARPKYYLPSPSSAARQGHASPRGAHEDIEQRLKKWSRKHDCFVEVQTRDDLDDEQGTVLDVVYYNPDNIDVKSAVDEWKAARAAQQRAVSRSGDLSHESRPRDQTRPYSENAPPPFKHVR